MVDRGDAYAAAGGNRLKPGVDGGRLEDHVGRPVEAVFIGEPVVAPYAGHRGGDVGSSNMSSSSTSEMVPRRQAHDAFLDVDNFDVVEIDRWPNDAAIDLAVPQACRRIREIELLQVQ